MLSRWEGHTISLNRFRMLFYLLLALYSFDLVIINGITFFETLSVIKIKISTSERSEPLINNTHIYATISTDECFFFTLAEINEHNITKMNIISPPFSVLTKKKKTFKNPNPHTTHIEIRDEMFILENFNGYY